MRRLYVEGDTGHGDPPPKGGNRQTPPADGGTPKDPAPTDKTGG